PAAALRIGRKRMREREDEIREVPSRRVVEGAFVARHGRVRHAIRGRAEDALWAERLQLRGRAERGGLRRQLEGFLRGGVPRSAVASGARLRVELCAAAQVRGPRRQKRDVETLG